MSALEGVGDLSFDVSGMGHCSLGVTDEYRAGGRLNLIIGKRLTASACKALGSAEPAIFVTSENPRPQHGQGYTLAQKMIGRACGLAIFGQVGCRVEVPGCSLCMGNQGLVQSGATVISTSTRNFDNRLGDWAQVYLASTELRAIAGLLGRSPEGR